MFLGLLSHCRGCMSKSSVASILPCLVMSQSQNWDSLNWGSSATKCLMTSYSNMRGRQAYYCQGSLLLRLWEPARSDQRLRCTDKDQSNENEGRPLISAIRFLSTTLHNYSHTKPETCESLALQDYNNWASDDERAIVTHLDIQKHVSNTGLACKVSTVR